MPSSINSSDRGSRGGEVEGVRPPDFDFFIGSSSSVSLFAVGCVILCFLKIEVEVLVRFDGQTISVECPVFQGSFRGMLKEVGKGFPRW